MLRNSENDWGWLAKTFHWLIAVLILVTAPLGYLMSRTYMLEFDNQQLEEVHILAAVMHHSIGLCLLLLIAARLFWRLRNPVPSLPASIHPAQRAVAKWTHLLLYALLFLAGISGWLAVSSFADAPVRFFGFDNVPRLISPIPFGQPYDYSFYANIHRCILVAGLAVLAAHIAGACFHEFIRRDNVLRRMWPFGHRSRSECNSKY